MDGCQNPALQAHRVKKLEERAEGDRAAIEASAKALNVLEAEMESMQRRVDVLERKLDEVEREPAQLVNAWKLAAVAALASLAVNAFVNGTAWR